MDLGTTALAVLRSRYFLKDSDGAVIEDIEGLCKRVASAIAQADALFGDGASATKSTDNFYGMLRELRFIPNSPTLMNAGKPLGQLAACFVLPIDDTLDSIFETLKYAALIHQSGGGTGFSFSRLRPKGDLVQSTRGVSSGPVSFMKIFDVATETIKQGGTRRGANMGVLRVDHPDIMEFIQCKDAPDSFRNFNISVGITAEFIAGLNKGDGFALKNPRSGKPVKKASANDILKTIAQYAWKTGDPGIINLHAINSVNPTPPLGDIECTNPCGEQPLLPNESCTLGSLNLSRFVKNGTIDHDSLRATVADAVHFLDNVVELNRYPLKQVETMSKRTRKIGLGVMGFADMLILLGIPYESAEALKKAEEIMSFINTEAVRASQELAKKRGAFPEFANSIFIKKGEPPRRNATVTTIAPTGTISIIAGTSSGIEPNFAYHLKRNILDSEFEDTHPIYERHQRHGMPVDPRVFVTAFDITPTFHLKVQHAFQKHTENAVSKTINLPESATVEQVEALYREAIDLGLKGTTIYRDQSKPKQTLNFCHLNPEKEC